MEVSVVSRYLKQAKLLYLNWSHVFLPVCHPKVQRCKPFSNVFTTPTVYSTGLRFFSGSNCKLLWSKLNVDPPVNSFHGEHLYSTSDPLLKTMSHDIYPQVASPAIGHSGSNTNCPLRLWALESHGKNMLSSFVISHSLPYTHYITHSKSVDHRGPEDVNSQIFPSFLLEILFKTSSRVPRPAGNRASKCRRSLVPGWLRELGCEGVTWAKSEAMLKQYWYRINRV